MAEEKELSFDEQLKWYNKQIKLAKVRYELAKYNALKIRHDADRVEAMVKIARFSSTTEKDLGSNTKPSEGNDK